MGGAGIVKAGLAAIGALVSFCAVQAHAQQAISDDPPITGDQVAGLELACDTGDMEACKRLGDAYSEGQGVPRVADIARILYEQACNADIAAACDALGTLNTYRADIRVLTVNPEESFAKACKLGLDASCLTLAIGLDSRFDDHEVIARLEEICEAGNLDACKELADFRLSRNDNAAHSRWAGSMLDARCLAFDQPSCETAIYHAENERLAQDDRYGTWMRILCDLGSTIRCEDRARFAVRSGTSPEALAEAQIYLGRVCAIEAFNCWSLEALHNLPSVQSQCLAGDQAACGQWGQYLQAENFILNDREGARPLLAKACLSGERQYCADAVALEQEALLGDQTRDKKQVVALMEASCQAFIFWPCRQLALWYLDGNTVEQAPERGIGLIDQLCKTGEMEACLQLADWHRDGSYVDQDWAKAADLYAAVCQSTDWRNRQGCEGRDRLAVLLPDLGLPVAGDAFEPIEPPMAPEELAALIAAERECDYQEAIFRGELYWEEVCDDVAPRGRVSTPIAASRAPWQALLWRPVGSQNLSGLQRVACGGTLIRDGWILTAAHCMAKSDLKGDGYTIRLSVSNPKGLEGFEFPILEAIPHPGFKRHGYAFDIGLIRYDTRKPKVHSWPYSPSAVALDPKPIDGRAISEEMKVYAYGWGWTEVENSQPTEHLQSIPMKLATMQDCEELTNYTDRTRKDAVLCAAGDDGAQACFGDSGGGLFYYGDGAGPVLIGVVSAGKACGTTGLDSRYPRVAKVRDWIEEAIEKFERRRRRSGR